MAQQVHQSLVQPQRPSGSHDQLAFHGSPGGFAGSTGANGATGSCLVSEPSIDATVQVGAITPKNGQHHRCEIYSAIAVTYAIVPQPFSCICLLCSFMSVRPRPRSARASVGILR